MPEPGTPKPEADESAALPFPGSSRRLPSPGPGPTGLEETAATESLMAAHAQLALPQAAVATMSDDELAAQLSALQAERDRRQRAMLPLEQSGDNDGQPKACYPWFGCAPACDYT